MMKKRAKLIFLLTVFTMAFLSCFSSGTVLCADEKVSDEMIEKIRSAGTETFYRVLRVVDGGTIVVDVDGEEVPVRYIGVDYPPMRLEDDGRIFKCGYESAQYNKELMSGREVSVKLGTDPHYYRFRDGSLLAYVYYRNDAGNSSGRRLVNTEIIDSGWAEYTQFAEIVFHEGEFAAASKRAREKRLGVYFPRNENCRPVEYYEKLNSFIEGVCDPEKIKVTTYTDVRFEFTGSVVFKTEWGKEVAKEKFGAETRDAFVEAFQDSYSSVKRPINGEFDKCVVEQKMISCEEAYKMIEAREREGSGNMSQAFSEQNLVEVGREMGIDNCTILSIETKWKAEGKDVYTGAFYGSIGGEKQDIFYASSRRAKLALYRSPAPGSDSAAQGSGTCNSYDSCFDRAEAAAARKDYAEVIAAYTQALPFSKVASSYIIYNNRGNAYKNNGDYELAVQDFDSFIELKPDHHMGYANRCGVYVYLGEFEKAVADCNKSIEINPNFANSYGNRGWAYLINGELEAALADFNKGIELNPFIVRAYVNRGAVYILMGEFDLAIEDSNKAIALDPSDAEAYLNRGTAYSEKGDYNSAMADYKKAGLLDPEGVSGKKANERIQKITE